VPEAKAIDFEIPPSIGALLDRLASMHSSLVAYMDKRSGLQSDSTLLAFKLNELWGIMQAVSVLYGSVCQDKVQEALETYKNLFEVGLDLIYGEGLSQEDLEDLNDMLFRLKVATIMLIAGCSGLPAIVKAPPEPSTEPSGR
jgi:hypothetical protein